MPSTSAPSDSAAADGGFPVRHYDGVTAVRRSPLLVIAGDRFTLEDGERLDGPFAFADLVGQGHHSGNAQFGLKRLPGWRIDVAEPVAPELAARLPGEARYGGLIDRIGLWRGAIASAVVAALFLFGLARTPRLAARLLPASVERRIGDAMVGDFGNRTCNAPAGSAALRRMVARLGPSADAADIRVVNVPIVNAVTLPGGHVLVFDGLIRAAKSPDEVAGVVGHELGHVANRDVVASLIRQLGLSVVLGGLSGNVGGWANALLAAGYSRDAESAADGFAIDTLRDARIAPAATAGFFARMARDEPRLGKGDVVIGYLSSHPLSGARRQRFIDSGKGRSGDTPVMTAPEWAALRNICKDDPNVSGTELRL